MLRNIVKIVMASIIAVGLFGCTQHNLVARESQLDKNWGRSFESARYNQILNPDAEKNLAPVEGLEGPAAEKAIVDHLSGKAPKQESSTGFGVGTFK